MNLKSLRSCFEKFYPLFLKEQQKVNLTRFSSREELFYKHFVDSATLIDFVALQRNKKVLDVGTGGGFPGLVLAMLMPEIKFVLCDSIKKKIESVKRIAQSLSLKNIMTAADRVEVLGRSASLRDSFDVVVSRAVAELAILVEYCLPFVRTGGSFIAYKGPDYSKELDRSQHALQELHGKVRSIYHYELPQGYGSRVLVVIEKMSETPQMYPRMTGRPTKKPLFKA